MTEPVDRLGEIERARTKRTPDYELITIITRILITIAMMAMFCTLTVIVLNMDDKRSLPEWIQTIIIGAFAAVSAKFGDVVNYWIQTSQSSADKNAMIKGK